MKPPMPEFIHGDARHIPLLDDSVDLICTSPPFLNLRSYQDAGEHYGGQIGVGTRDQFLEDLWQVTAEMARVLKPTGSIFVELGDSYTNKTLNLSPHRYAIGCVDRLGLYLRAEIVWQRPNGLPESVTDRVRRSHSVWFHLVKQPRYFAAVAEIRERTQGRPDQMTWDQRKSRGDAPRQGEQRGTFGGGGMAENPLGKLPGSVWEVATQPLKVPAELGIDHFAAFPFALVRPIILGWSPREVCTACGEGRRPEVLAERHRNGVPVTGSLYGAAGKIATATGRQHVERTDRTITGYACACPDTSAPATPGTVLDPFSGTGTTALVATMLGRQGVGVELSQDYIRLAEWRASDPKERARAAGLDPDDVAKLRPQLPGQLDMFGEGEAS